MRLEDLSGYVAELSNLIKFEVKTEDDEMGHLIVTETKETFVYEDEDEAEPCPKDDTRHALTIEQQHQREIDQRRTRLVLQDDEQHGYEHNHTCLGKIGWLSELEVIPIEQIGKHQRRRELAEFSRLDRERSDLDPRM